MQGQQGDNKLCHTKWLSWARETDGPVIKGLVAQT